MKFFKKNNFGKKLNVKIVTDEKKENEFRNAFSNPLDEIDLMERSKGLIGKLNPEMDRIADSYNLEENDVDSDCVVENLELSDENKKVLQDTSEKTRNKEILEIPYPKMNITEKNRDSMMEDIKRHPDLYMGLPVNERMGKIYTNKEFTDRSKKVLAKKLP